jgi:polysaccharide deacetylase family protein (PEP-CTERM system associated)
MTSTAYRVQQTADSSSAMAGRRTTADVSAPRLNAFTVDVEDYYQVEAFKGVIDSASWDRMPSRVDRNTDRLLGLFDKAGAKATFFVLGWIAERHPGLVRRIVAEGHELGSHGYAHQLAHLQSEDVFRDDVRKAKHILEDLGGVPVRGYRAPTFSIRRENWWAYDVLSEEGYAYSSSLYPVAHDLYGMPEAPVTAFRPQQSSLVELPLSTFRIGKRNLPCSGGGYFRLLPYAISRRCIDRSLEQRRAPYIFYCHPWEFDPEQPRIDAGWKSRFRHYTNISRMESRVSRLLRAYSWGRMDQVFASDLSNAAR